MDKYTKAVLTVIALCVLALPVKAVEKVWYCDMTEVVDLSHSDVERYVSERFKMKVTPVAVEFGSGGFTHKVYESMVAYADFSNWHASTDGIISIKMADENLSFVIQGYDKVVAFLAKCDDF